MKESWLIDENLKQDFFSACKLAVETKDFDAFKKHPAVNCIIENSTEQWADNVRQSTGLLFKNRTPNEVRYLYTWMVLTHLLGTSFSNMHISEIGGGYGGMCEVAYSHNGYNPPTKYYAYDIPEVSELQCAYLTQYLRIYDGLGDMRNIYFIDKKLTMPYHDLCIAWCSWSELDDETKIWYLENVMCNARHMFIGVNWDFEKNIELIRRYIPDIKVHINPFLGKIIYT